TPPTAAVPIATPAPTSIPAAAPTAPSAKVILATSDWGNELFTDHDVRGEGGVYQRLVHDYFIHTAEGKGLVPGIAKSWSFTPNGLTWTFEVREGVKFHDGTELTVEDVAFSLEEEFGERSAEKGVSPAVRAMARSMEPFRVTGPNAVSVTTTEPLMFLSFNLSEMAPDPSGTIFSRAYRESVGRDGYNDNPSPGATGPWDLIRHDKGSLMRYERFDDYWKIDERNHQFQTLEFRLIPELSTRIAALRAGEVDLTEANLEVRDQIEGAGGQIIFAPEAVYLWMVTEGCFLEVAVIPCEKEVRQALNYAIDKELIANQIYGPEMAETRGWAHVSPSSLGYEPDLDSWPYDPEKARQLLAQVDCADGACFPDPYTLYTWEASELPFVPEVAQLVCQQWEENLGINCEVGVGDSVSIKDKMHGFKIPGNYVIRPNEDRFDGGSITYGHYGEEQSYVAQDPELRRVTREALGLIGTMEERHQAYHDLYVVAREENYEWSLFTTNTPWGVGPKIKTWQPWPLLPYASALWTIELE
ncbi:MAG: ABC transporter substrate-binding protein, partial [Dehalococcoidia bacterium]